jgi:hypothetical protein
MLKRSTMHSQIARSASGEINSSNATVVIAYDYTRTSLFDIEAPIYQLKFKLEGINYLI